LENYKSKIVLHYPHSWTHFKNNNYHSFSFHSQFEPGFTFLPVGSWHKIEIQMIEVSTKGVVAENTGWRQLQVRGRSVTTQTLELVCGGKTPSY
jgi:hypothetical protein